MDEKKEPKEGEEVKPLQSKRQLVIETDGDAIIIVMAEMSKLEIREIGRQLMNIK